MKKIIHIITDLNSGGAENMLHKLLKYSDEKKFYHEVISLMDEGIYGKRIKEIGVEVHSLKLNKRNMIASLLHARKICKKFDVVDTWLVHADLFGFIVAKILLKKKLIWNIRHSNLDEKTIKPNTYKVIQLNSFLSRFVNCITFNSNKALETHSEIGYKGKRSVVLPNGFELNRFFFHQYARTEIRKELGINETCKVIITVGRWNIQKDYDTLVKSLNELKKVTHNFLMVMCGSNLSYDNKQLTDLIDKYKLKNHVLLLGIRDDIPQLLSASDVYVSSSIGESFSNSIGEAMACELPCVVTDVGDSKLIVGDTGSVVQPKDYEALSNAMLRLIQNDQLKMIGKKARDIILKKFDINVVAKLYEENYTFKKN